MLNYLKNYKPKNPRALRLGLAASGLSLMKGAGQTYDKPVSTVGLMGEAGLHGLGTYETALDSKMRRRLGAAQIKTAERDPLKTFREKREITAPERKQKERLTEAQIIKAKRPELTKGAGGKWDVKKAGVEFYQESKVGTGKWIQGEDGTWKYLKTGETGKGLLKETGLTTSQKANLNKAAYEHADKFIIDLTDPLTGKIMNLGTNLPMSDKAINALRERKLSAYLDFAMGGRETASAYTPTAYTPEEIPEVPSFTSSRFPVTRELRYKSGITSRNVFRKGLTGAGRGLMRAGRSLKKKYLGLRKPTVGLGRYGQIFGK